MELAVVFLKFSCWGFFIEGGVWWSKNPSRDGLELMLSNKVVSVRKCHQKCKTVCCDGFH